MDNVKVFQLVFVPDVSNPNSQPPIFTVVFVQDMVDGAVPRPSRGQMTLVGLMYGVPNSSPEMKVVKMVGINWNRIGIELASFFKNLEKDVITQ